MKEKSAAHATRLNLASVPTPVNSRRGVTNITETGALSGLYASMVPAERMRHVSPTRGARALGQLLRDPTMQHKTQPSASALVSSRHQESVPAFEAPEVLRARERIRRRQLKASGGDSMSCSGDSEAPEEDLKDQPQPVRRRVAGKQFRDGFTAPEESGGASEPSEASIEAPTLPLTDVVTEPGTEQATAEEAISKKRGRAEKQMKEVSPEETAQGSEQSTEAEKNTSKRRGRPQKEVEELRTSETRPGNTQTSAEKATSKRRGRPENEVDEVSPEETTQGTEQTTADKPASKRRGRPEKEVKETSPEEPAQGTEQTTADKPASKRRGRPEKEVKETSPEEPAQGTEQTTVEKSAGRKRGRAEKEVKEVTPQETMKGSEQSTVKEVSLQETTQGNVEQTPVSRRARTKKSDK